MTRVNMRVNWIVDDTLQLQRVVSLFHLCIREKRVLTEIHRH